MSYDLIVYTRHDRLPSPDALGAALAETQETVEIVGSIDLRSARGHVPARIGGRDTGFEVLLARISTDEIQDYKEDLEASGEEDDGFLKVLTENDTRVTFRAKGDDEITAARAVANALASLSGGMFSDPQMDGSP